MNSLSPIAALLATLAVLAFLMTASGFLALVWKASWAMRGFVEAEQQRAQTEKEIAAAIREFSATQRSANERIDSRLTAIEDRQQQQSITLRAMWRQFGAENEAQNEATA